MSGDAAWPHRSLVGERLVSAGLVVAAGFLGSRALGLLRNVAIGQHFGTSPELDAYFAAFRLPDVLFQLLAGAALTGAFLPTWAQVRRESAAESHRLASAVVTFVALATAGAAGVGFMLAPLLVPATVPGMPADLQTLTVRLTRILLLSTCFFSVSGIVTGMLQGEGRFALPALAPLLYNGAIIIAALIGNGAGVERLAWGGVAGAVLHLAIQVPGLRSTGFAYRWTPSLRERAVGQVLRLAGPRVLGLAVGQLHFVTATVLASLLAPGSLAALSYAWAVLMMPLGVFGMALATAVFPAMAAHGAAEERQALGATVAWSMRLVLFLAIPSSVGLLLLSGELVTALFARGEFGMTAAAVTAGALAFYAAGLPGHAALEVLTRSFYALRDTTTPLSIAGLGLIVNVLASVALMGPMGASGLALAASLAAVAEASVAGAVLWTRIGPWPELTALGRVVLATAGMAALLAFLRVLLPLPLPLQAMVMVPAGAVAYLGLAWLFRSAELRWLLVALRRDV